MTMLCMGSAELINCELKCLDRWLKSNKISINADANAGNNLTSYMLFSIIKNLISLMSVYRQQYN